MMSSIHPIYGFRRNQGYSMSYTARANYANSLIDIDQPRSSDNINRRLKTT